MTTYATMRADRNSDLTQREDGSLLPARSCRSFRTDFLKRLSLSEPLGSKKAPHARLGAPSFRNRQRASQEQIVANPNWAAECFVVKADVVFVLSPRCVPKHLRRNVPRKLSEQLHIRMRSPAYPKSWLGTIRTFILEASFFLRSRSWRHEGAIIATTRPSVHKTIRCVRIPALVLAFGFAYEATNQTMTLDYHPIMEKLIRIQLLSLNPILGSRPIAIQRLSISTSANRPNP